MYGTVLQMKIMKVLHELHEQSRKVNLRQAGLVTVTKDKVT